MGYLLGATTGLLAAGTAATVATATSAATMGLVATPTIVLGALTTAYWRIGLYDMKQTSHAIRRNYPVLGNMRYIMETVGGGGNFLLVVEELWVCISDSFLPSFFLSCVICL